MTNRSTERLCQSWADYTSNISERSRYADQKSRSVSIRSAFPLNSLHKDNAGDQIAVATPCKPLRKCIDLIVMAPGKSEYFSDAFFKPSGASGEAD